VSPGGTTPTKLPEHITTLDFCEQRPAKIKVQLQLALGVVKETSS
jgi:hypothetical protein